MSPTDLAPRTSICLGCRTALYPGEPCDHPRHGTPVSLTSDDGRRRLADRVWGPASLRARARQVARSGTAGGGAGALFEGCHACSGCGDAVGAGGELGAILAVILVAAIAAVVLYLLVRLIVRLVNRARHRLVPNPADRAPAALSRGRVVGVVETAPDRTLTQPPLTLTDCVAYGIELSTSRRWRKQIMLRDGATSGFRLRFDDGRVAVVPPGRAVVDMHGAIADRQSRARVDAYLAAMTDGHPTVDDMDLIPCERAAVRVVLPGDRIELFGELIERPVPGAGAGTGTGADTAAAPGGYRDAPPTRLELTTVGRLRVLEPR